MAQTFVNHLPRSCLSLKAVLLASRPPAGGVFRSTYWLHSPGWDSFWLLSGLWLVAIVLTARVVGLAPDVPSLLLLYAPLLLWGGHIVSPMLTAWSNAGFRALMWSEPNRFIVAPVALMGTSIALGIIGSRELAAMPAALSGVVKPRLLLFLTFAAWNTWHFAAQHFGVLSIYRRQAGLSNLRERQADRVFTIAVGCILLPLAWYAQGLSELLGPLLEWVAIPGSDRSLGLLTATTAVLLTGAYIARELRRDAHSIPRALYIASIGIQPPAAILVGGLYHFAAFTVCHWLIAIALSARIMSNRLADPRPRSPLARVVSSHAAQATGLVVVSILLYFVLRRPSLFDPFQGAVHFGYSHEETTLLVGALSGAFFGITFMHFLYDRYVYNFGRPEVRTSIGTYLFSPAAGASRRPSSS